MERNWIRQKLFYTKDSDENVKVSRVDGFDEKKIGKQKLLLHLQMDQEKYKKI